MVMLFVGGGVVLMLDGILVKLYGAGYFCSFLSQPVNITY